MYVLASIMNTYHRPQFLAAVFCFVMFMLCNLSSTVIHQPFFKTSRPISIQQYSFRQPREAFLIYQQSTSLNLICNYLQVSITQALIQYVYHYRVLNIVFNTLVPLQKLQFRFFHNCFVCHHFEPNNSLDTTVFFLTLICKYLSS